MNYNVVELNEKIIVGKSVRTSNKNLQSTKDIGAMWQRFLEEQIYDKIDNKVTGKGIGLYTNYEGDAGKPYTFVCGVEVFESTNRDMETYIIPKGQYAKFSIKGHMVTAVADAWQRIWKMPLDRAYKCDFEVYHRDSENMDQQSIDIYISLLP